MTRREETAAIYLRVSSDEQAGDPFAEQRQAGEVLRKEGEEF
jgi:DNA invertase Pin-like site-specific DNA recombinase